MRPCATRDIQSMVEEAQDSDRPMIRNLRLLSQQHPNRVLVKWRDAKLPVSSLNFADDRGVQGSKASASFPYSRLDVPEGGSAEELRSTLISDTRELKASLK